jgi:integrase
LTAGILCWYKGLCTNSHRAVRLEFHGKKAPAAGTPTTVLRTVPPKRPPNTDLRTREHLTEAEVERLIKAVNRNRHGHRDATMVLVAYRHGLRVSELVDLRLGGGGLQNGQPTRTQGQAGHPQHASDRR